MSGALKRAGIRIVLTGGGCAVIHTRGQYQSADLDLIVQSSISQQELDAAMAQIGFARRRDHYVHPETEFFVEFLRGPLSIGADIRIKPVELRVSGGRITALSATDSCRDRLAAFYHWGDLQSLETAVAIASRNRVDITVIRKWSEDEDAMERFAEFKRRLSSPVRTYRRKRSKRKSTR